MKRRGRVAGLAVVLATGCSFAPMYQRPATPLPAAWRTSPATAQTVANMRWWEIFRDPALQALLREALERNTDLSLAAARTEEARAAVGVVGSAQWPQVQVTGSAGRVRVSQRGGTPIPPGVDTDRNRFALGAALSYQPDFWGEYRNATQQARFTLLATEEARNGVLVSVVSGVAQAYFQLRELDLELSITRETVRSFEDSLRLTRVRFEGDVASELDVRQAETALYGARAEIPILIAQIAQQENALAILLGRNPGPIPRGRDLNAEQLPPAVAAGLPSQLLERRPDVRQAEAELRATYAGIGVARAQFFPQLPLTGSAGVESTTLASLVSAPALLWQLAAGLSAPLFTGGRLKSNLAAAEARRQQAEIEYRAAVLRALGDVEDSLVAYHSAREELDIRRSLAESAAAALRLATTRYASGVSTYLEVLDAQRQFFSAQLSAAQTRGDVFTALVRLYAALGGGW